MGASAYLQLRRGRWYVRIRLPSDLATCLGRTHIVRSLGTNNIAVARQRRRAALAAILTWQASQTVSDGWSPSRTWKTVSNGSTDASSTSSFSPQPKLHRSQPLAGKSFERRPNNQAKPAIDRADSLKMLIDRWLGENVAGSTQQT